MRPGLLKKWCSLLLFLPFAAKAQDLTGLWKGTLYNDTTGKTLRYEVGISIEKGKMTGFSHTFFIIDDKQYYGLKRIRVKKKGNTVIIEDDGLLADNYPIRPPKGVHQLSVLELNMEDSIMVLSGPFTTTRTREYHSLTGKVYLQRKNDFRQSALVPHLTELGLASEISFAPPLTDDVASMPVLTRIDNPAANAIKTNTPPPTAANTGIIGKKTVEVVIPEPDMPTVPRADNPAVAKATAKTNASEPAAGLVNKKMVAVTVPKPSLPQPAPVVVKATPTAPVTASKSIPVTASTPTPADNPPVAVAPVKKDVPPAPTVSTPAPIVSNDLPAIGNDRKLETIETLFFQSDSLELTLYDNGEVDGDTVSVYLNGRLIMPKQGLSTRAIKKTLYLPPGTDSVQLIMYAESLGSIPPNTGLLVVHDGEAIYEVRFSADMKKNAGILLRRKPK